MCMGDVRRDYPLFGVVLFTLNIALVKHKKKCGNKSHWIFFYYKENVKRAREGINSIVQIKYVHEAKNWKCRCSLYLAKKKVLEEKKTEMFLFNATASLMICVDSARTHLLLSCLSTGHCGDKEVYDWAHVMFYILTLLIPSLSSHNHPQTLHTWCMWPVKQSESLRCPFVTSPRLFLFFILTAKLRSHAGPMESDRELTTALEINGK